MPGKKREVFKKTSNTPEENLNTPEELSFKTHTLPNKNGIGGDCSKGVQKLTKNEGKIRTPQGIVPEINGIKITELDISICKHLNDHCGVREVSRRLCKPVSGISYRVRRLEKAGLLEAHSGVYNTKNYTISANLQPLLTYGEAEPPVVPFTAHAMSFIFPIISGEQPISHLPKLYFLRNVGSAEKGIKMYLLLLPSVIEVT